MSIGNRKGVRGGLILFLSAVLLGTFSAPGFAGNRNAGAISAYVYAALGGTFTDDPDDPGITVIIATLNISTWWRKTMQGKPISLRRKSKMLWRIC